MKKLLLFLSVLVLIFALSSCDKKEIVQNNGYTITDNTNCKFIVKVDPFIGVTNKDIQVE